MPPVCTLRRIRFSIGPDNSGDFTAVLDPESGLMRFYTADSRPMDPSESAALYENFICEPTGRLRLDGAGEDSNFSLGSNEFPRNEQDFAVQRRALSKLLRFSRFFDKMVYICSGRHRNTYRVSLLTTILPGTPASDETGLINKKLPKELILRIFSYLDILNLCRCGQVCKLWNNLALDGSNWQTVDLFAFQKDVKGPVVESLAKRCGGFLKKLSLFGCENVQDGALHTFAAKCPHIEELNLRKCKRLTDNTCESLGRHCKKLRRLDLDCCDAITERGLKFVSDGCPHLEHMDISWCQKILDDGLESIARGCSHLKQFICKGCSGISDEGMGHIARYCQDLRVLNLHSCAQLTDQTAQFISEGCHRLEYLCMSKCTQITDRSLQALSLGCHLLKDLELAACSQLTDGGFNSLAKNCHELERMDMEDCSLITDQTLSHLATGCPNLINLSLSHCELVTDEGIRQLSMGLSLHDKLEVLELDNCPLITDSALEHLKECRTLEKIDLYDCQLITRGGIRRFKQHLPEVVVHAYFAPSPRLSRIRRGPGAFADVAPSCDTRRKQL